MDSSLESQVELTEKMSDLSCLSCYFPSTILDKLINQALVKTTDALLELEVTTQTDADYLSLLQSKIFTKQELRQLYETQQRIHKSLPKTDQIKYPHLMPQVTHIDAWKIPAALPPS